MTEKRQRGRPKKSEQTVPEFQSNQNSSEPIEDAQVAEDDDSDLTAFQNNEPSPKKSNTFVDNGDDEDLLREIERDIEKIQKGGGIDDVPTEDYSPTEEPVMDRGYTKSQNQFNNGIQNTVGQQQTNSYQPPIPEPLYKDTGTTKAPDVDESLLNPNAGQDDIPKEKPKAASTSSSNSGQQTFDNGGTTSTSSSTSTVDYTPTEDAAKSLSPKQKREDVKKTTEAILEGYRQLSPIPFIMISQYSQRKLKKAHKNNEIDLNHVVTRDGRTLTQYVESFNTKVEETFKVTDQEIESLREPLFDVLMEQDIAMTPTQRLIAAVGQIVIAKGMLCFKFLAEKRGDMEMMKEMHAERMGNPNYGANTAQPQPQQTNNPHPNTEPVQNTGNVKMSEPVQDTPATSGAKKKDSDEAEIISETKDAPVVVATPSLDEALNLTESADDNTPTEEEGEDIPD